MSNNGLNLNKFSFYTICGIAILYIVSMILSLCGVSSVAVGVMQAIAAICTIVIVSILAWRHVRTRTTVWKVLYLICMALVIVGIIVPLIPR